MNRKIAWESLHLEYNPDSGKMEYSEEEETEYADSYELAETPKQIVNTPFGAWEIHDEFNPLRQFKIWQAHTNFDITPEVRDTIKAIDGVEILQIFTRYSFFVGVGQLFDFKNVRLEIEKQICGSHSEDKIDIIENPEVKQQVLDIVEQLKETNENWAVFVFPNGNIDLTTETDDQFDAKLSKFRQAEQFHSGICIES